MGLYLLDNVIIIYIVFSYILQKFWGQFIHSKTTEKNTQKPVRKGGQVPWSARSPGINILDFGPRDEIKQFKGSRSCERADYETSLRERKYVSGPFFHVLE